MKITRISPISGPHTMDLPTTEEQLRAYYEKGMLIQHALPELTPLQREFLLTGYTEEEQKEIFRNPG